MTKNTDTQVQDFFHTLGYAIGATIAAACLGLLALWVVIGLQAQHPSGREAKPANYRGVKK